MPYHDFNGTIKVKDSDGVLQLVKRYDIDNSNLGLGFFINPDGSMTTQLEYAISKVNDWTSNVS